MSERNTSAFLPSARNPTAAIPESSNRLRDRPSATPAIHSNGSKEFQLAAAVGVKCPPLFTRPLENRRVQHPAAQDLIAAITRIESTAALVSVFLAVLHVERLAQQLALLYVVLVHAFQQRGIVVVCGFRAEVAVGVG